MNLLKILIYLDLLLNHEVSFTIMSRFEDETGIDIQFQNSGLIKSG